MDVFQYPAVLPSIFLYINSSNRTIAYDKNSGYLDYYGGVGDFLRRIGGGERGIRTLDTLPYTHFPGVRLRPLGHLSKE